MKKYEVRTVDVETKNGKNSIDVFLASDNQTTELVKSFDTLEEARAFFAKVDTSVRYMSGYYLHSCKIIEENDYDEEDNWRDGGDWWDYEFPNFKEEEGED